MTYFMDNNSRVTKKSSHRVLMNYMHRQTGYHISFLEEDCKTSLPKKLTFATADKILEMNERWGEDKSDTYTGDLKRQIGMGRPGGIWLILSAEEYRKLK